MDLRSIGWILKKLVSQGNGGPDVTRLLLPAHVPFLRVTLHFSRANHSIFTTLDILIENRREKVFTHVNPFFFPPTVSSDLSNDKGQAIDDFHVCLPSFRPGLFRVSDLLHIFPIVSRDFIRVYESLYDSPRTRYIPLQTRMQKLDYEVESFALYRRVVSRRVKFRRVKAGR